MRYAAPRTLVRATLPLLLLAACDRPTPTEVVSALDRVDRAVRLEAVADTAAAFIPFPGQAFARLVSASTVDVIVGDTLADYRAVVVQRAYVPPPGRPFYTRRESSLAFFWRGQGDKGLIVAGESFRDTLGHRHGQLDWRLTEQLGLADPLPRAAFFPRVYGSDWAHFKWPAQGGRARIAPLRDLERPCDLPLQGRGSPADSALAVRCEAWLFTVELDGRFVPVAEALRDSSHRAPPGGLPIGIARQTVRGFRFVVQCDDTPLATEAGCGIPSAERLTVICRHEELLAGHVRETGPDSLRRLERCWNRKRE